VGKPGTNIPMYPIATNKEPKVIHKNLTNLFLSVFISLSGKFSPKRVKMKKRHFQV
jgi:hypothetical protein